MASDGADGDNLGYDVGVHGNSVVAGAVRHGFAGAAYIFESDGGEWRQEAKLTPAGINSNAFFGMSVALHGDIAAGGAIGDNPNGLGSGSAVVFERQKDGSWLQVARLAPSDGDINDFFGGSVDVSDGTIVGGAHNHDDRGINAGAAFVFERCGDGCWTQTAELLASDGMAGDNFGSDVAIDGDVIVVGAERYDDERGAAYVFERSPVTGKWVEVAKLLAADGAVDDMFGVTVDVHADVAVIGAERDDDHGSASGSAYVFRRDPDAGWVQDAKLTADDGQIDDLLGRAVTVYGGTAVVGAPGDDDNGVNAGSAYVYRLSPLARRGDLDCDGAIGFSDLLELLSEWGPVPDCPPSILADIDEDCDVDFDDLLMLLAGWT